MAKLMIEIDIPDMLMRVAMSERSKKAIEKVCQELCQREVDKINTEFVVSMSPLLSKALTMMETRIRNGKMKLNENAPPFLKHMFQMVEEGASLEKEVDKHRDELCRLTSESEFGKSSNPFDGFNGLIS